MAVSGGICYFCATQTEYFSEEDIRVAWIDIRKGGKCYKRKIKMLKKREEKLAPFFVEVGGFRVHVTPLDNPKYQRSSFHIIRLWNSKDTCCLVDLLIQDTDLYLVGFRRHVHGEWGNWFTFEDVDKKVVRFLRSTKIKLKMCYPAKSWVTPGGSPDSLAEIFFQFLVFSGRPTNRFKRAVYSAMVIFCEVRRLRSINAEVSRRVDKQLPATELSDFEFEIMRQWSSASAIVLVACQENRLSLGTSLPNWWMKNVHLKPLRLISCLIGAEGELLVLKFNKKYIPDKDRVEFEKLCKDPSWVRVPDHDFVVP